MVSRTKGAELRFTTQSHSVPWILNPFAQSFLSYFHSQAKNSAHSQKLLPLRFLNAARRLPKSVPDTQKAWVLPVLLLFQKKLPTFKDFLECFSSLSLTLQGMLFLEILPILIKIFLYFFNFTELLDPCLSNCPCPCLLPILF